MANYVNTNQEDIIELEIDYRTLNAQGRTQGDIGDFSVSFPQTINLDTNSDYDICCSSVFYDQPYLVGASGVNNSYFLYCSLVEQSRVGGDVGNVLCKTLTSYASTLSENNGNYVYAMNKPLETIIPWKRLNVKDFSTIDFAFRQSNNQPYPFGVTTLGGKPYDLIIKIAIRQSPTSKTTTQRLLGRF
tara:strand:+ start:49 stop:612 length:564 start_codon:yes stop_codon:yes gene_type:complete